MQAAPAAAVAVEVPEDENQYAPFRRRAAGRRRSGSAEADQFAPYLRGLSSAHRRQRRDRARRAGGRAPGGGDNRSQDAGHRRSRAVRCHSSPTSGIAGDHPDRARHDSRGGVRDAARRVRFSDQAFRQPGAVAEGRRCRASEWRRVGAGFANDGRMALRNHHPQSAHGRFAAAGTAGGGFRRQRADLRRIRHRQGASGTGDSPRQPPYRQAVRRGQLRRNPRAAARVRIVRPRARRVQRCGAGAQGFVSGSRRRNDFPGRDRRHAACLAGEVAAGVAGGRSPAGRSDAIDTYRRARDFRHPSRSGRSAEGRHSAKTCTTASTSCR